MYTYLIRFIAHYLQLLGCSIKDERKESIEMHKPLADWSSVTDFCFWWPHPIPKKVVKWDHLKRKVEESLRDLTLSSSFQRLKH